MNLFDSIKQTRAQTKLITDSLQDKLNDTIYENAMLRAQSHTKFSEQQNEVKGTSANIKFSKPSILGKSPSTSGTKLYYVTPFPKTRFLPKVVEKHDLTKPVTSHLVPKTQESKVVKNNKLIALGMFKINPTMNSMVDKFVPNKHVKASVRTNLIIVSQSHIITKKYVNSDSNGLSSTGVDNTAKTRRPHPRSNTKNDRVPSTSKSSCINNNKVEVEEHHRNLLLSKNQKHMSSECNNVKLAIRNDISEVVCSMCYPNLFMVRQLGLLQAHDKESEAAHQLRLEVYGNYLEVAFRRNTCFVRNLEGVDLLKGNRTTNLYTINLHEMASASPICLIAHATSTKSCVESINGKRYVLVIVDDYSRYTLVHFLRSKDEAPEVIKTFLKKFQVLLQAPVIIIRTDNGIEFTNQVLKPYFDNVGISHQTSSVRTLQQNGVVERRNRALVEAARTILIFSCALVYNRRTKKIMETMNVTFDELSSMAIKQRSSKPELQGMTTRHISSGLALTYAPLTITSQKLTERELDILFETMYDDYIDGQPLVAPRTAPAGPVNQNLQTPNASTTVEEFASTPTTSSSQSPNFPNTSQDVNELPQQQHVQQ
ncbi:retrovirus-related pol polyprotein from transposon TNT 1-94 [Tanacetum coccineum]